MTDPTQVSIETIGGPIVQGEICPKGTLARLAELEAASRWIPVEERLPEVGYRMFVYDALYQDYYMAYVSPDGATWTDLCDGLCLHRVTHWLPIPVLPEASHD